MASIGKVDLLITDWGQFECPPDLAVLWDLAKKKKATMTFPAPHPEIISEVPDWDHPSGQSYYRREKEILDAVNVIMATGTMVVVPAKKPNE